MIRNLLFAAAGGSGGADPGGDPVIGETFEGGYYVGKMRYSDGDYYLIVAPKATTTFLAWKTTSSLETENSLFDGAANTAALATTTYPAANYCAGLTTGGFGDWYLPARDELELCYRNLKFSAGGNNYGTRQSAVGTGQIGENLNSIPVGVAYTSSLPVQTTAPEFKAGAVQAFDSYSYWTSTNARNSVNQTNIMLMGDGSQLNGVKTVSGSYKVRPVRRVKVPVIPGNLTFVGELTNTEFATYAEISSLSGIAAGTLVNEGGGWLKFSNGAKSFIVAKKAVRLSLSWNTLDAAGCVLGTKTVSIQGVNYKVRLIRILATPDEVASEWAQMFYPLVSDDANIPIPPRNLDAPYIQADLTMGTAGAAFTWCQDTLPGDATKKMVAGYPNCSSYSNSVGTANTAGYAWRPCLESI